MATKKTTKGKGRGTAKKPAAKKSAVKAVKPATPQIWRCTVDGWVRYQGRRYEKGETILVHEDRMTEADMDTLRKYFEPVPTEVMSGVSEPIQPLDEGDNHVRSSSD